MTFAQVLQPAIDLAENGFPLGETLARAIATSQQDSAVSVERCSVYMPGGSAPKPARSSGTSISRAR